MKLLRIAWIGAFACAVLIPAGLAVLSGGAVEAWMVIPHQREMVDTNKATWVLDAPPPDSPLYPRKVMDIYGIAQGDAPIRFLFVKEADLLRPEELPSLRILIVDQQKGQDFVQLDTVLFTGKWVTGGAFGTGLLLAALWAALRRRRPAVPAEAPKAEGA
jgi:hypothetical protein